MSGRTIDRKITKESGLRAFSRLRFFEEFLTASPGRWRGLDRESNPMSAHGGSNNE